MHGTMNLKYVRNWIGIFCFRERTKMSECWQWWVFFYVLCLLWVSWMLF